MRYGIIEFIPNRQTLEHKFTWVARDLALSSANDAIKAWGYQAGIRGGWMERIEDTDEAFDKRCAEITKYYKPLNLGAL